MAARKHNNQNWISGFRMPMDTFLVSILSYLFELFVCRLYGRLHTEFTG